MKYLVIGSSGLVGSQFLEDLRSDRTVDVYAVYRNIVDKFSNHFNTIIASLDDNNIIQKLPEEIDVVFYFAQSRFYKDSPQKNNDIFNVNVKGLQTLLDYSYKIGVKKFVYLSSGGVYGVGKNVFSEEYEINLNENYSFYLSTKLMGELLVKNYSEYFSTIIIRPFFIYGKNQSNEMLIPRLISNIKKNLPITLHGEEGIKINPIHVKDFVNALKLIIENENSGIFNVCGDEKLTIKEISQIIANELSLKLNFIISNESSKDLLGDNSKIKKLGFNPKITFKEGIKELLDHV